MKVSYYALLFSLLYSLSPIRAQDFNDYQLLESTGTIPSDFLTLSSEKYKQQLENTALSKEKETNKNTDKFLLESNFLVDNLLRSARVLFNDPITDYVNRIADELLKDDPAMRKQLRFYAVRSSAVNAFATNQGIIFVNVGLIAQLETEAQLAFILAHEITHVRHGHALEMYLESERIDRFSNRKQALSESELNSDLVAKNHYSKELEVHADAEGLELFLESKYSLKDLDGTFDVLQYSYLPFDIIEVERSALELPHLQLEETLFLAEEDLNPINGEYEEDDSKSTHPSIDKRRAAVAKIVDTHSNKGRKSFLVGSKTDFETMRDVARFEVSYYYLHQMRFQDALYATYILQQKYPQSKYLKKIRTKALYGYTKFRNELSSVKPYSEIYTSDEYPIALKETLYEDIEGPSQQIYHWLTAMEPNEVTVYALRYAWNVAQEYPEDKEVRTILEDLFDELAFHYEKRSEFSAISYEDALASQEKKKAAAEEQEAAPEEEEEEKELSKYDKIKRQKKEQIVTINIDSTLNHFKYAFVDIHADSTFKALFEQGRKNAENYENRRAYYRSTEGQAELQRRRKHPYVTLGIDSVLVYNPMYWDIEGGSEMKVNYLKGESAQLNLTERLKMLADKVDLQVQVLSPNGLSTSDADAFNELRVLAEWLSQQNNFGGNIYSDGYNQDKVDDVVQKYGTPYLLFTGVVNAKEYTRKRSFLWVVVFDLRTGSYQVIKDDFFRRKAGRVLLNAQYYDALLQIKTPSERQTTKQQAPKETEKVKETTVSTNPSTKKDKS
jgi:Zn-dependent protease with chaperone function